MISTGVICREFIGRRIEAEFLVERLMYLRNGQGGSVLVRGGAGIGKTRLIGEFARSARELGVRYVDTACSELGETPYAPAVAIGDALDLPAVSTVLKNLEQNAASASTERAYRFAAAAAAFAAAADTRPFVATIEDIQWATPATLDIVRHLMVELRGRPALFVFTERDDEPISDALVVRLLNTIARECVAVLTLEALAPREIKSLISSALRDDGRQIPSTLTEEIVTLSDGRPFYAEELLRGALDNAAEVAVSRRLIVPPTVRASVAERLASFSSEELSVLSYSAVIGARVNIRFLTKVLGMGENLVLPVLRKARNAQLIVELSDAEQFTFRHALTREAIYDQILRAEARILHKRIAEELLLERADPVQIAYHAWCSGDPSMAFDWNRNCGDSAAKVYAHVDAIRHFERAYSVATSDEAKSEIAERLAQANSAIAEMGDATRWFSLAIENAQDVDRAHRLGLIRAQTLFENGDYDGGLDAIDAIIALLGDADTSVRFEAELRAAALLNVLGRSRDAQAHLLAAERLTCERDLSWEARYQGQLGYTLHGLGRVVESSQAFILAEDMSRTSGDLELLGRTLNNHANLEASCGEFAVAVSTFQEALAVTREIHSERFIAWFQQNVAYYLTLLGRFDEAIAAYAEASGIDHGVPIVSRWLGAVALRIGTLTGDDSLIQKSQAERLFEQSIAEGDGPSATVLCGALILNDQMAGETGNGYAEHYLKLNAVADEPWIGEAAARLRPDLMWKIRERISEAAKPEYARALHATVALLDARIAMRERRRHDAETHARTALEKFRDIGCPLEEAYAREIRGDVATAVDLLRRIGAHAEVARLVTVVPKKSRRRGESSLTAREGEIANQVCAGKTNREVAEILVISERTVETHVAAIYSKLGVSNRRDLMALLKPQDATA